MLMLDFDQATGIEVKHKLGCSQAAVKHCTLPSLGHSIWNGVHSIWNGIHSIWNGIHSIWNGIHSIWNGIHSMWNGIHSIWTRIHSIWIPGGLLDTIHYRNGRCENKIILIHSNTIYFI